MKKLLTSLALVLLVSAATFAQTRYTIVAFHKLQPGKTMDDAIANEKQWLPIHQARKAAGIISSLEVIAGTKGPQKAKIELMIYDEIKKTETEGDGPVDAIFKAIKKIYPHNVNLQLYQVQAVTEGTDAQATVSVRIEEKGKISVGQAADTDTLVASAKAYINALNKLIIKRKRTAPSPDLSASA